MKFTISILLVLLVSAQFSSAQLSEKQYQKIDSLFLEWNRPNHPGGSIGVMLNGEIVFSKAYGLSSLEYLVPNSTETIYNTASVSKQFTAMGIVILESQGKLSVDDDIRKYIPGLNDFGETVTIRHMLHHTSGLRSLHALLGLAGWRGDDSRTDEDLFRFMENQVDLNFKPGEEYLYCNTGYIFMARIIEEVTGKEFTTWMKKSVFDPLGMVNTYVEDKYNRVVPQNATSYYGSYRGGFDRSVEYWGYVGSGNMHSTTDDMLTWLSNFHDPQPGWGPLFDRLQTLDNFNNGEPNNYAFGVNIGGFNGAKRVSHGGSIGGFRSFICSYPEQKLDIVVIANFSSSGVGPKSNAITEIILGKSEVEENTNPRKRVKTIKVSKETLETYEGSFWNDNSNYVRKIYLRDDTLRYFRGPGNASPIVPIGKDEFQMLEIEVDLKVKFEMEAGKKSMVVTIDDGPPIRSEEFRPIVPSKEVLDQYTGTFYSPEIQTIYTISLKDDSLVCHHTRHGELRMKLIKENVVEGQWPFNMAKFKRDEDGEIEGLYVSNGRVRNLWFAKMD